MASTRGGFDSVALVGTDEGATAVWSDSDGAHARVLGPNGRPRGRARRIGPRCDGGLDATPHGSEVLVACLASGRGDGPGAAFFIRWIGGTGRATELGPAGRDSRGIALAVDGGRAWIVWHDGTPGRWRIRRRVVALADRAPPPAPARALSRADTAAEMPAIRRHRGRALTVWMETWLHEGRAPRGRIVLRDGDREARRVADVHWAYPLPVLASDPEGLILGFRDVRPGRKRAGLYLQRLSSQLEPRGAPSRVGRADGPGRTRLLYCNGMLTSFAPRTWNQHRLVSLARITPGLQRRGREHQIYQWGVDFTRVDALCRPDHILLLLGERGNSIRPSAHLRTTRVELHER